MKKTSRVIEYSDERNDDFATGKHHKQVTVDGEYKYIRKNLIYRFGSFVLYRFIATPFAYIFCKVRFGIKIKGKKNLKNIKGGYFLYGNHTQSAADAYIPSLVAFPKRCNIIVSREAVSIPFVRHIVPMVGGVPLPSTLGGTRNYLSALKTMVNGNTAVTIYPEAHIWPYCNMIRNFSSESFTYPIRHNVPAVGFTVTYRKRRGIFSKLHPHITVTIGKPIYPSKDTNKHELRDNIYHFMCDCVKDENSYAYIKYVKEQETQTPVKV